MFCIHKYGEIKGGYQYCVKCNKAIAAPPKQCTHHWELIGKGEIKAVFSNETNQIVYVQRCTICGELKKFYT